MKLYIDSIKPTTPGWTHVSSFKDLQMLLNAVRLENIERIYFGLQLDDIEYDMSDCALYVIEVFAGIPLPECTVKHQRIQNETPANILRYYIRGNQFKDLCTEIS